MRELEKNATRNCNCGKSLNFHEFEKLQDGKILEGLHYTNTQFSVAIIFLTVLKLVTMGV